MGLDPRIWGKHAWFFFHSITLNYPTNPSETDKNDTRNFFMLVGKILPCEACRINYYKHLDVYPITDEVLKTKENLVKWLINIHNEVNNMSSSKQLSYDDFLEHYKKIYYEPQKNKNDNYNKYLIIILVAIIVVAVIYKYRNNLPFLTYLR